MHPRRETLSSMIITLESVEAGSNISREGKGRGGGGGTYVIWYTIIMQ